MINLISNEDLFEIIINDPPRRWVESIIVLCWCLRISRVDYLDNYLQYKYRDNGISYLKEIIDIMRYWPKYENNHYGDGITCLSRIDIITPFYLDLGMPTQVEVTQLTKELKTRIKE